MVLQKDFSLKEKQIKRIARKFEIDWFEVISAATLGTYLIFLVINLLGFQFLKDSLPELQQKKSKPAASILVRKYENPKSFDIPILLYHYVEDVMDTRDTIRKSLDIRPFIFENQVSTLIQNGYTFLTPSDINDIFDNKRVLPLKPVIISFDDGYHDFYTDVLPVLKKYHARAVAYIISGLLDRPNYMTSDELRRVISTGLVEIGCHTVHHPNLKSLSIDFAQAEIVGCENDISSKFGVKPVSFAYPYGAYDPLLFNILKQAGLKNAVTTKGGVSVSSENIYEISRIRPGGRMGEELISYLRDETLTAKAYYQNLEKH